MDKDKSSRIFVSAVIPAFNEQETISAVVSQIVSNPSVNETIVVDDGSKDNTAEEAKKAGAKVIVLEKNAGKGNAMDRGVTEAKGDIIFFSDADILGLDEKTITHLIQKATVEGYDMFTLIRGRKNLSVLNDTLTFLPILGGERVVVRKLWNAVPKKYKNNFEIEAALNYYAKKLGMKYGCEVAVQISQVIKEKKWGFWKGFFRRILMIYDVAKAIIGVRLQNKKKLKYE